LENAIYVIKCLNAGNPVIANNARKTINYFRAKQKKQQQDSKECNNLATTNYTNFDGKDREPIWLCCF
jgi:hypothetical protein